MFNQKDIHILGAKLSGCSSNASLVAFQDFVANWGPTFAIFRLYVSYGILSCITMLHPVLSAQILLVQILSKPMIRLGLQPHVITPSKPKPPTPFNTCSGESTWLLTRSGLRTFARQQSDPCEDMLKCTRGQSLD